MSKPKIRVRFFLVALTVNLALLALADGVWQKSLLSLTYAAIVCYGPFSVLCARPKLALSSTLGVLAVVLSLVATLNGSHVILVVSDLCWLGLSALTAHWMYNFILRARRISDEHIAAATAVYVLLGLFFATAYTMLERLAPGSFTINLPPDADEATRWVQFVYFSFMTLTTVGYGDILPASPLARILSAAQGVAGVMYLAVLVSRLVGLHMAHSLRDPDA